MCVYLFFEVRSSPAAPQPLAREASKDEDDKPESAKPNDTKTAGAGLRGMARKAAGDPESKSSDPTPPPPTMESPPEGKLEGPKLDAIMAEANKAYDKMDFEEARSIAQRVLKQQPTNTRMLRIMTSASCIEVDAAEAQKWFNLLPVADREQMKTRCQRYGVTFTDPPAK